MKLEFIELTATDDTKILVNPVHIGIVEPHKNGSILIMNLIHYSIPKKVKESYEQIKLLLATSTNT